MAILDADNDAARHAIDAWLARMGVQDAQRFDASDRDRLNDAICAGQADCVLIADIQSLLDGIWDGDFELDRWLQRGVRIELADPPFAETPATQAVLAAFYRSVAQWRSQQRKKKLIAACILSAAALLALAAFYLFARPPLP